MKALIKIRLLGSLRGYKRNYSGKKKGTGIAMALLLVYALGAIELMLYFFASNLSPLIDAGLGWFFFASGGLAALALNIIGNVFTTQSQLFEATDNELLLSLPVKPRNIFLSRLVVLIMISLALSLAVTAPFSVVYFARTGFSAAALAGIILSTVGIALIGQSVSVLLGWLLHLMLSKMHNKAIVTLIWTVAFLGLYFYLYYSAGNILNSLIINSAVYSQTLRAAVWPLYAMGCSCCGNLLMTLVFAAISAAVFAVPLIILALTFVKTVSNGNRTSGGKSPARARAASGSRRSPVAAIRHKELRRFLTSPVYLSNMGLGLIMTLAAAVAAVIFRGKLLSALGSVPEMLPYLPLFAVAALTFTSSVTAISAPSVSLEGKSLWILRSVPLDGVTILHGKLSLHLMLTIPVTLVSSVTVCIALGIGLLPSAFAVAFCVLINVISGLAGLIFNLLYPRFDWINEAAPCKQSAAVTLTMFSIMGLLIAAIIIFAILASVMSVNATVFLGVGCALLAVISLILYRCLNRWGAAAFTRLDA